MKVYDAVANAFVKEGTAAVFGLLGDGQLTWWSSMAKYPQVKIIDVRDEGAALAMAQGWARATDKVGVCSVTHGPGISRLATSLITSTRSGTPIVVYTSKTALSDEHASKVINQDRLVHGTEAGYIEVLTPSAAENAVRQAFYRARMEARPYVLAVPLDIQSKDYDADGDEYKPSWKMFPRRQRIRPDTELLNEAVKIIAESRKPVVVVGRGAMNTEARQAAERLAKRIGALIATSLLAKGTLAESEFHAGISGGLTTRAAMKLFEQADCVIAIGASLNADTLEGGYIYPNARIVQIGLEPHIVMGNDDGADCYIQGDAALTVREIEELLAKQGVSREGFHTAEVRKALLDKERDPAEFDIEAGTLDPREAIAAIDERLPPEIGMVTGTGHCFSIVCWHMRKPRAMQFHAGDFTGIGQVLGNGIGAAVGYKHGVVAFEGDGGAMQNIQELDTASRLGVKLLYVVVNDEAYGAEYHKLKAKGLDPNLSVVRSPDFAAVARAFGCRGRTAHKLEEVSAAVDEFLRGDGPLVLDLRISRNVLSIPMRRVHFAQDA